MDRIDFWHLIDRARDTATLGGGVLPTADEVGEALTDLLRALPPGEIIGFQAEFERVVAAADRWEFCAACLLISGYLSADTFTDFRAGLIGLGRETFERIQADPDALAGVAEVRAVATDEMRGDGLHGESIGFAAENAYEARTGEGCFGGALLDEIEPDPDSTGWPPGGFGPPDRDVIAMRLPRLAALFPARRPGLQPRA